MTRCVRPLGYSFRVPRHEYIHSVRSLTRIAQEAGLGLDGVEYDSTAHQFVLSEGYRLGLNLHHSHQFPAHQMQEWERLTREVNETGRGDQAIFYFRA